MLQGAGGMIIAAVVMMIVTFSNNSLATGGNSSRDAFFAPVIGVVFIGLAALQIWVGIGLRNLKPWARIASGVLAGIGLLGFPIGTLINGYILYLLFSKKGAMLFSPDYQRVIAETPHIKYKTSIIVWIVLQ
jgi:hypothetical protein